MRMRMMLATLVVGVLLLAAQPWVRAVAAADMPDSWITVKTKIALMTTEGVSTRDLNVDTVHGLVTLHGKVSVETEKRRLSWRAR